MNATRHAKVMEAIEESFQISGYAGSARLSRAAHAAADAVLYALDATEAPTGLRGAVEEFLSDNMAVEANGRVDLHPLRRALVDTQR